jgi:hypothetical protein
MGPDTEKDKPIGTAMAAVLIVVALCIDGLQALLTIFIVTAPLTVLVDIIAGFTFTLILFHHGGTLITRRGISLGLTALGEFFPPFNALPLWTAFAIYTIVADRVRRRIREHQTAGAEKKPSQRRWRV